MASTQQQKDADLKTGLKNQIQTSTVAKVKMATDW